MVMLVNLFDVQTVVVNPLPSLNILNLDDDYCLGDAAVLLEGNHAPDGTFSIDNAGPILLIMEMVELTGTLVEPE